MSAADRLLNRNFVLLWNGQAVSQLGNQAFAIAMAFWTLEATGSASLMGLLLAVSSLPLVLLAPIGGAVADRFSRIRIVVACDVISGLLSLVIAAALLSGRCSRPAIVALLFVSGLAGGVIAAFFLPALAAAIPGLGPAERLAAANSLSQFSGQIASLVGQATGGILYHLMGAARLFLFDGLTFFYCAGSEALVRLPPGPPRAAQGVAASVRQFRADLREGFAYMRGTPGVLGFIAGTATFNFMSTAVFVLLPFFVRINLRSGAEWYGFLLAAISCGVMAGFVCAGLVRVSGAARGRFLAALILAAPVPILITGFLHAPILALAGAFVLGVVIGLINVNLTTLLQLTTPEALRGRVLGLWTSLSASLTPLGMALGGFAGDLTGKNIPLVYSVCSCISLAVSAATLSRRSTRRFLASA